MGFFEQLKQRRLRWLDEVPEGVPPASRDRYLAARRAFFESVRQRGGGNSSTPQSYIQWFEHRTRMFGPESSTDALLQFVRQFSSKYRLPADEQSMLEEMLLARVGREK